MARRALAMAAGALSKPQLDGVERIIAVASGKGGVGKSTTAVNLAVALALKCKLRVGLLDADVYGPSIPLLMNLSGQPKIDSANKMVPLENYGVKCMSMGFLMDKDAPVVWRGPMVMSALEKLTRGVSWGKLDIMVVDMPPGTGDAQISVSQRLKLAGAVIVSTPQDIALLDARRGTNMFQKVHVPVRRSIVLSIFLSHIFGHGGCETTAKEMQIDFLGKVPLDVHIRETSDEGKPIVASSANSDVAAVYNSIATRIVDKMRELASAGAYVTPNISVG
ncbi:iron-sulfur protein NUBPL isoform X2 [Selaginella moellendorffii]|uniref:iron-sulfur protein NUBPL isoform X2 n=1 Tax=Selaginella moellendorffii TaxID=88036 RepID=UPI000D1D0974|nr:iron-sulfur protein NUBPL isoform X2 [Selaginella moellendorffii]|eukprot:XP_024526590.1 iron-sulfur protein NUBPL isoform X2 [Selaginella moellendorffii]